MRVSHGHVSSTATPPGNPTWVGWRRTSAGTHLIVIPAGGWHGSPSPSARGHSVKPAVSTAGPAPTDGEASNEPAAASPLFKHHCETTVFIRFVVEVGVIWLRTALNGSLKGRQVEMKNTLLSTSKTNSVCISNKTQNDMMKIHFNFASTKFSWNLINVSASCNSNHNTGLLLKDAYFSNELQHSLDALHHPLCFTTNQHYSVC